jgi:ABC-type cobalamin/Fe3+-siderophores transport system ATPase subunit
VCSRIGERFRIADHVAVLTPRKAFQTGPAETVLTPERLSEMLHVLRIAPIWFSACSHNEEI